MMYKFIIFSICFAIVGCSATNQEKNIEKISSYEKIIYQKYQSRLLELHNKFRLEKGYDPLILDKNLCKYAENHVIKMAEKNSLYHSKMSDLIKVNLETNLVGENIAWGQKDEESVVDSWMWSPFHRWNILGSGYRKVGFGLIEDKEKRKYWCAVFSD